jgi:hypothetical protein
MAGSINVNQNNNKVILQDQNPTITITDNVHDKTVNVNPVTTKIVEVITPGPKGDFVGNYTGSADFSGSLNIDGNLTISGSISASGTITSSGLLIGDLEIQSTGQVISSKDMIIDDLWVNRDIFHYGNSTNKITFTIDNQAYVVLGEDIINLSYRKFKSKYNVALGGIGRYISITGSLITQNITASGNISSSDYIYANQYYVDNKLAIDYAGTSITYGQNNQNNLIRGETITLGHDDTQHVTASGNISSSGNIEAVSFTGSFSGSMSNADTASYVQTAQTASYVAASNIYQPFTNITASGNISASGGIEAVSFTGSFSGSISNATTAQTASYVTTAQTASYVTTAQTASYVSSDNIDQPFTNITASGNISASGDITAVTASLQNINFRQGAEIKDNDSGNITIQSEDGAKIELSDIVTISDPNNAFKVNSSGNMTIGQIASSNITASGNISASGAIIAQSFTGSISPTSLPSNIISSSAQFTTTDDFEIRNITASSISASDIKATTMEVIHLTSSFITASTIITTGSNVFGDEASDTHTFIGDIIAQNNITASGYISTDTNITASGNISASGVIIANTFRFPDTNNNLSEGQLVFQNASNAKQTKFFQATNGDTYLQSPQSIYVSIDHPNESTDDIFVIGDSTLPGIVGGIFFKVDSNSNISQINHITASGNISASDKIYAEDYYISNTHVIATGAGTTYFGRIGKKTEITGSNIKLSAPITASGNISGSGATLITAQDLTLDRQLIVPTITNINTTHVTASGNISSSAVITANRFDIDNNKFAALNQTNIFDIGQTGQSSLNLTNITASGAISSSGLITAKTITSSLSVGAASYNLDGQQLIGISGGGNTQLDLDAPGIYDTYMLGREGTLKKWIIGGDLNVTRDISSSANISASLSIEASDYRIEGKTAVDYNSAASRITYGQNNQNFKARGETITLGDDNTQHITASGNISASAITIASESYVDSGIFHLDDVGTGISFGSDTVNIKSNSVRVAKFTNARINLDSPITSSEYFSSSQAASFWVKAGGDNHVFINSSEGDFHSSFTMEGIGPTIMKLNSNHSGDNRPVAFHLSASTYHNDMTIGLNRAQQGIIISKGPPDTIYTPSEQLLVVNEGGITSSVIISASAEIIANKLTVNSTTGNAITVNSANILLNTSGKAVGFGGTTTKIHGDNTILTVEGRGIYLDAPTTSSGDISASAGISASGITNFGQGGSTGSLGRAGTQGWKATKEKQFIFIPATEFTPSDNTSTRYYGLAVQAGGAAGRGLSVAISYFATYVIPNGYKVIGGAVYGNSNATYKAFAANVMNGASTAIKTSTALHSAPTLNEASVAADMDSWDSHTPTLGDYVTIQIEIDATSDDIYGAIIELQNC